METIVSILYPTAEETAEVAKVAATFFNSGFYVTNKSATRQSHLVLSADFTDGDTEVTLCGIEVEGAGLWPTFEWCADCLKTADPDDEPDIGQIEDEWNHPTPCDDMNCKEHGVAASLDRQSEFFARGRTLGDEGP